MDKRMGNRALEYMGCLSRMSTANMLKTMFRRPLYEVKRRFTRFVEIAVNDYRMIIDLYDGGISKELFLLGTREAEHAILLKEHLREGMVILDIGANIGYYSVMMARLVGPSGLVYAIEPSPANYGLLSLNLRLNNVENIVETYNCGISNHTGDAPFYQSSKSNWHTFYPVLIPKY